MSGSSDAGAAVSRPRGSESGVSSARPTSIQLPAPASPSHIRRPSLPMSPTLLSASPRAVAVPVPARHGSMSMHSRPHVSRGFLPDAAPTARSISPGPILSSASVSRKPSTHVKGASSASLTSLFSPSSIGGADDLASSKLSRRQSRASRRSFADVPLDLGADEGKWLDITGEQVLQQVKAQTDFVKVVNEDMGMEEAVDVMIKSNFQCLLVRKRSSFAFFDYADLNTFLILVLHASSASPKASRSPSRQVSIKRSTHFEDSAVEEEPYDASSPLDERSKVIVRRLRRFEKILVGSVCDISGKNPYHAVPISSSLRTVLPLFASGLHKVALTSTSTPTEPPRVITDLSVIEHLASLPASDQPLIFQSPITSPSTAFPLHPLISLPGTASVLDAMQVMSINGLSALGVLSGAGLLRERSDRRQSSGSSGSSSGGLVFRSSSSTALSGSPLVSPVQEMASPFDTMGMGDLVSVVTVKQCARLVVPSEGKQALGLGLEEMVKQVQYVEEAGLDRGEERVSVHTVPYDSTILHAAHLILATASSRVFLRPPPNTAGVGASPPLSPTPSLTTSQSSAPSSPSLSSLSLSDARIPSAQLPGTLPSPPATQLSAHYVVSTLDILSCLARAYHDRLTPPAGVQRVQLSDSPGTRRRDRLRGSILIPSDDTGGWELDPERLSRRRRQSSFAASSAAQAQAQVQGAVGMGAGMGVGLVESPAAEEPGKGFGTWRWASRVDRLG